MAYDDVEAFYRADPRRRQSIECDFGLWRDACGAGHRLAWLKATGELYALRVAADGAGGGVQVLGELPRSGHPNLRRADLIVEAALSGWAERCGQRGSLEWVRGRLDVTAGGRLAPIDWTVACHTRGCPRRAEPIAPHDERWAQPCESCLAPRLVVAHGKSAGELEAELRGGAWWLARLD
jgi:hypothetical protein